jgi:hypothetical protein
LHCAAHPPQHRDRLVSDKVGGLAPAEHREAARLVEIGGELGEELVVAQPDQHANRKRGFDPSGKGSEQLGWAGDVEPVGAPRSRKASSIDIGSTRGQLQHFGAHRPPDLANISPCSAGSPLHSGKPPAP